MTQTIELADNDIRGYLKIHADFRRGFPASQQPKGWAFNSLEDLVAQHGKVYNPEVMPKGMKMGKTKECFSNAIALVLAHPHELTYVEGFAMGVFPVHHGWAITKEGKVVDPTWAKDRKKGIVGRDVRHGSIKTRVEATAYLGIPIKLQYLRRTLMARKIYGVLDNWDEDYPILKGTHKVEDIIED